MIIAPNLTIRDQIADAVDASNRHGFYRARNVLESHSAGPFRAKLDSAANLSDCADAHIVVTNIQQLARPMPGGGYRTCRRTSST